MKIQCAWCGEFGHEDTVHPEARAEAAAWQREAHAMEFPFGDHKEVW